MNHCRLQVYLPTLRLGSLEFSMKEGFLQWYVLIHEDYERICIYLQTVIYSKMPTYNINNSRTLNYRKRKKPSDKTFGTNGHGNKKHKIGYTNLKRSHFRLRKTYEPTANLSSHKMDKD